MTKEQIERLRKWTAALRSGEYVQGRHNLKQDGDECIEWCCLGVACDIHADETGGEWVLNETRGHLYMNSSQLPPAEAMEWFGLEGTYDYNDVGNVRLHTMRQTIAAANDGTMDVEEPWSFEMIADAIDEFTDIEEEALNGK